MTDAEFTDELVARLNLFLEADLDRANAVLTSPLHRAGYASVGHFVGQLAMPRHITREASAQEVSDVKFVAPVVEDQKIVKFESLSGAELQERHAAAAREAQRRAEDQKTH
jgi:hypothetical protein